MLLLDRWQQSYKQLKSHSEFSTITELIEYLAYKLGTIIMNNPPGDSKSMGDMVKNEVNHAESFDFNKWYSFCPL